MKARTNVNLAASRVLRVILLVVFLIGLTLSGNADAGVDDVLFGVTSSNTSINPSDVNASNFADYFTYSGEATPSLTMGGSSGDAQIGAIYTSGTEQMWYQIRVIIDSNGDGNLTPFDWGNASHPWNMSSGSWNYPDGYPDTPYDNGNNDGTIDFDAGESFPWDTFQWWFYEADYDKTDNWWMEAGQLMNVWWSGRDQEWNMLPNGNYKARVWVDENDDGTFAADEANKILTIAIETANITGTVVDSDSNPIQGAEVEAGSYMAWGNARTNAAGQFTVSGLQAGAPYHVRVMAPGKVTAEVNDVVIPEDGTTASAGTITMSNAVTITGTLKLDRNSNSVLDEEADQFEAFTNQWGWEQFDLWVWVDAFNTQGPGWGNTNARFEAGDSSINFSINIPPPSASTSYQINVNADGFATDSLSPVTVTSSGGDAGTIVLTKASILTGSVQLPEAITGWNNIDVQAINTSDSNSRYWGWGNIDGNMAPTDTGTFSINGIPAGTYNLEVRVMGYAMTTTEITVVQGVDTVVDPITISTGNKITGTLTIQGDTTDFYNDMYGGEGAAPEGATISVWLDAWSPSGGWSGTNANIPVGVDQSVTYNLGGLSDGTFEVHCWLGEGYELVDDQGDAPVYATLSAGNATKNLVLQPYSGEITGTISGPDGFDINKVMIEVKRPWDWGPANIATVANGGIDAGTNVYTIEGLGTDDYVVKAGVVDGWVNYSGETFYNLNNYDGEGWLLPNEDVGIVNERVFIQNGQTTTKNIALSVGYTISGSVSLLTGSDAPWHDADGDGKKDTDEDPALSEVISMGADIVGQQVMAMPMDMMFMGGSDPRMGTIQENGSFTIAGLAPGVYMVQPPFSSNRISNLGSSSFGDGAMYFEGDQETHHWTTTTRMVVITDSAEDNVNFELGNGYTVTGTLTLPEAQTYTEGDWSEWWWVGQLELETAAHQFMGHGKPLFKKDFNNTTKYNFTFNHVANGDYLVRFWTDRYVPGGAKVTVNNAGASVNVTIEEGANLVGKLVDADTGEAITSDDGIMVRCEAFPHVEGSWRETRDDDWSLSYIENDSGIQSGNFGGENGERENKTPGKFHLNSLPTGYKYVVVVEAEHGMKSGGAKNYVGQVVAGIDIPEGATGDIDVGTIELKEGTTIKGRLTDTNGNPVAGIDVFAFPSDSHDGSAEAEGTSDSNGYYTCYGVNPDVEYYDMIAAERPFMFDDWGKTVEYGEKRKYNVAPGSTGVNFTLGAATASLSGTLTIPALVGDEYDEDVDVRFMLPFKGEGEEFPAATIILQRKGVVYEDVLDGMEEMSVPRPAEARTASYNIENLEPGTYKIFYMNYGLPTLVYDNVVIADGSNSKDVTWTSTGFEVSGSVGLSTGGYPSTSDISGVICMNASDQSLIFGELTQEADDTYSAYLVPGLANGQTYQLVFYKETGEDDMPQVIPVGSPFTVSGADIPNNTATITRDSVPMITMQAIKSPVTPGVFDIGIFSTTYLVDSSVSVIETAPTVDTSAGSIFIQTGAGTLSNVELSGDKRKITATYTKDAADGTVELTIAVHYGDNATTKLVTRSFSAQANAANADTVSTFTAGQVKLGNGDASQIFVPAGSFETSDNGKMEITIAKTDEEPGSRADTGDADEMGLLATAVENALPSGVTAEGNVYEFHVDGSEDGTTVEQNAPVTIQVQYDPEEVDDPDEVDIYHFVGGEWTKEDTNRVVDEENYTISVEVTSLSPFVVGKDTEVSPLCVVPKVSAASKLCAAYLKSAAKEITKPDTTDLDALIAAAEAKFEAAMTKAEAKTAAKGLTCPDATAADLESAIDTALGGVYTGISAGIDDTKDGKKLGSALLKAVAKKCGSYLKAEGGNVKKADAAKLSGAKTKADVKFEASWSKAITKASGKGVTYSGTSMADIEEDIETLVTDILDDLQN